MNEDMDYGDSSELEKLLKTYGLETVVREAVRLDELLPKPT